MKPSLAIALALLLLTAPVGAVNADVKTIRPPGGGEVPEVVLDARGVLHMTYGRKSPGGTAYGSPSNGYYVQSKDGGKTFAEPIRINQRADTVTTGMERGPKLALGKDGAIHLIWQGYYKKGGGVWYTRSTDDGKTFEAERDMLDVQTGADNATIAADRDGNVFVLWTDGRLGPDPKSPVASPIFMARSTDNGKTFSKNEPLRHDYPGRACGCCRLEARVGEDHNLYVAFRGGYQNIRDPYLLKGRQAENDFKTIRISADNWDFG